MQPQSISSCELLPYLFTDHELARLTVYRAAVAAGFYTDACVATGPTAASEAELGIATARQTELPDLAAAGFTCHEIARLVAYRGAITAGLYRDSCDEGGTA
jgi:hypothetical protein